MPTPRLSGRELERLRLLDPRLTGRECDSLRLLVDGLGA
jgi:DNA-binding CsgD family transcriptional regulator